MALVFILSGSVLLLSGCSDDNVPEIAGSIGGVEIAQVDVSRLWRFEQDVRERKGLQHGSPPQTEANALETLIRAQWIHLEARKRGLALNRDERLAAISTFEDHLGLTPSEIREIRVASRVDDQVLEVLALAKKFAESIVKEESTPAPSSVEMQRYYRDHVGELGEPERRTFNFLLVLSESEANLGRRALDRGKAWGVVAPRYSSPEALESVGWRLADMTRSELGKILTAEMAEVAFDVPAYELIGPRLFEGGWIVFEAADMTPSFRPSFSVARQAVRYRLLEQRENIARSSLNRRLRAKYRGQTQCAADFQIRWC